MLLVHVCADWTLYVLLKGCCLCPISVPVQSACFLCCTVFSQEFLWQVGCNAWQPGIIQGLLPYQVV
jgi:hypothetical protein